MRRKPSGNTCSRKRRMNSPASSVIALVLPTETNAAAVTIDEPAGGDGNVMGVAAEIVENLLRPAEGPRGIDHPLDLAQRLQMCGESRRVQPLRQSRGLRTQEHRIKMKRHGREAEGGGCGRNTTFLVKTWRQPRKLFEGPRESARLTLQAW